MPSEGAVSMNVKQIKRQPKSYDQAMFDEFDALVQRWFPGVRLDEFDYWPEQSPDCIRCRCGVKPEERRRTVSEANTDKERERVSVSRGALEQVAQDLDGIRDILNANRCSELETAKSILIGTEGIVKTALSEQSEDVRQCDESEEPILIQILGPGGAIAGVVKVASWTAYMHLLGARIVYNETNPNHDADGFVQYLLAHKYAVKPEPEDLQEVCYC